MLVRDIPPESGRHRARRAATTRAKWALTLFGGASSELTIHRLNAVVNYLTVGAWFRAHGLERKAVARSRSEIFERIASEVRGRRVVYLEFGVANGESMRQWSCLLEGEQAILHGFDSFRGLPADWNVEAKKGHFSTDGVLPDIDDERVSFISGWFEETLAFYQPPPHDVLVVNMDADLYSSTACILNALEPYLVPGTFIYFDEFSDRCHELRAFDEFLSRGAISVQTLASTLELSHVAFQVIGGRDREHGLGSGAEKQDDR